MSNDGEHGGARESRLLSIFGRPFNTAAPDGMCPWAEQQCDDQCSDFSGCRIDRECGHISG